MQVNLMLRYLLAPDWWPLVQQQDYQFMTGKTKIINADCHPHCSFRQRRAAGDAERPFYVIERADELPKGGWIHDLVRMVRKVFARS